MIVAVIRTALAYLTLLVATPPAAGLVILAGLMGRRDRAGSIYDAVPRIWSRLVLAAAGIEVVVHGDEHRRGDRHIFVANHNSGIEIFALFARLRWVKFVAKAELFHIPIVGRAMRHAGMIPIERQNQVRARASILQAGGVIANGASVILFPEGTRSESYTLRPFKKGAFVLAIDTQAPIVPVAVHGTLEIMPKGSPLVRPGRVDLHFLPPLDTAGKSYADRDALAEEARSRIVECLAREYGASPVSEKAESRAGA